MTNNNIVWHEPSINIDSRWKSNGYKSSVLWFTGLSASGKSTIAHALDKYLHEQGMHSYVLDGDNVRHGLNKDLDLSPASRKENIRRIGEVSKLFVDAGLLVITAFIAPYREDRRQIRDLLGKEQFIEVFIKCSINECERRDPKGLYKKAKKGEIKEFTGVSAPYEEPENPEIILETDKFSKDECVKQILNYLVENKYVSASAINQNNNP
ncbi:putative adenylyl-sulfate kinase [bacterium BMS3Bbin09]|nr:putative adenylyl-sulfate kinase [bacterium BMS3Bbin09]